MRVDNEAHFQKWMTKVFLPIVSDGTIISSDGNNANGVSDITWIVPNRGIFAIELKFTKIKGRGGNSKLLHGHSLSSLQSLFLKRWASASSEREACLVVGTDLGEVVFFSGEIVFSRNVNIISSHERSVRSNAMVNNVVGKTGLEMQNSIELSNEIDNLRNFLFEEKE